MYNYMHSAPHLVLLFSCIVMHPPLLPSHLSHPPCPGHNVFLVYLSQGPFCVYFF